MPPPARFRKSPDLLLSLDWIEFEDDASFCCVPRSESEDLEMSVDVCCAGGGADIKISKQNM